MLRPGQAPAPASSLARAAAKTVPALLLAGAVFAGIATLAAPQLSGARPVPVLPGLPDAGGFTRLALPLTRTAYDIAAVAVVGMLLLGSLLLPAGRPGLEPAVATAMRRASQWAVGWAACAVALLLLTLSDVLARPLPKVLAPDLLGEFAYSFGATRALMSSAFLAILAAVAARSQPSAATRWLALLLAIGALLPPLLAGHSGHASHHTVATLSISAHVVAASGWVGGLLALVVLLRSSPDAMAAALPRYSAIALACCVTVAISGSVNSWTRLSDVGQVWGTPYGRLIGVKAVAVVVLACLGAWHRRRTLPALRHSPRAFVAVAAVELVVMLTTVGLAVALARTAPPPSPGHRIPSAATASWRR